MDFEFSAEQEMLRASVRAFLADKAPLSIVRRDYRAGAFDPSVWTGLGELGVLDLPSMVDSAVVLEELGRAVCPAPYASSCVAAGALGGDTHAPSTIAVFEPGSRYSWRAPACRVTESGLTGVKVHVPDAASAREFLVTALDDRGRFGVYATADGTVQPAPSVDGSRKVGRVEFRDAPARRLDVEAGDVARMLDRFGVAYVVDGVGAAQRALELAVEYAKERVQFDRPIGSFQAVQHLCADMLRTVELGRAAAYYACWALDDASPDEAHRAATLAQAFAADAFPQLGGTAIQVFGGIGFTWEHDIHLYYKRLLSGAAALGTATGHLDRLAALAID